MPASLRRWAGVRQCTTRDHRRSLEVGFPSQTRGDPRMKALGTHIVCELSGCDARALSDLEHVKDVMDTAVHRFQPQGVSGVVVIAESHLSIHTWPETGYAAMDFYTCGDHTDPWRACEYAAKMLDASTMRTTEVKRGIEAGKGQYTHVVTADAQRRELVKRTA